ncbi:MAG: VCBS repeat-containing protein, partial [Bacteroidia bacterium]|nr:VCBS repeat-containing protein [Bacteroidia bacterium]
MRILLCFATTLTILACACQPPSQSTWTYQLPGHGTSSTPRFADLNEDGILDIVLGAGTDEHHPASHGVIALNGQNGSLLWHAPSTDQIVGSASFIDIDQDGT